MTGRTIGEVARVMCNSDIWDSTRYMCLCIVNGEQLGLITPEEGARFRAAIRYELDAHYRRMAAKNGQSFPVVSVRGLVIDLAEDEYIGWSTHPESEGAFRQLHQMVTKWWRDFIAKYENVHHHAEVT